ncbi:MAG: glycosyltransferase family 9 protein, partial [Candidatus Delongbacteria bacterium]|nr:glycosyltransferase family 9 protein [Candidatus Delongbacteria bacterium]
NSNNFRNVHIIKFLKNDFFENMKLLREIMKEKYDISILVFPSNHFKYHLVHFFIGAKKRFGISYIDSNFPNLSFLSGKLLKEDRTLHAIEQNFRLFEFALKTKIERSNKMRINLIDKDRELADDFIKENSLCGKIFVGFHPGSDIFKNMEKKRWSSSKYGELMKRYSGNKNIRFLLFGGKSERQLNEEISSISPDNSSVVKAIHFFHSAAIIERCSVFVCGDTGLMHTASALDVPAVAIFGPTNSTYTKPLNEGSEVVKRDYPCIPCYEYSRTPLSCGQDDQYKCLQNISVDEIKDILDKKLNLKE